MLHTRLVFAIVLLALTLVVPLVGAPGPASAQTADTPGVWAFTDNTLPAGRTNLRAVTLPDGRVLLTGGMEGGYPARGPVSRRTDLYDPATNRWTVGPPMNAGRVNHTATLLLDGRVLVVSDASAELYDPSTNSWTPTGGLQVGRDRHRATLLLDGRVLVTGGYQGCMTRAAEIYHPATGTWATAAPMIRARADHVALVLTDGRVLVAGGDDDCAAPRKHATAELYDPATGRWSMTGALAVPRSHMAAIRLRDGRVLAAGGYMEIGTTPAAEIYNPATGSWSRTTDMARRRFFPLSDGALLLPDGNVMIAGDEWAVDGRASSEIYQVGASIWAAPIFMNDAHCFGATTLLADGRPLIVSGYSCAPSSQVDAYLTAEVYGPAAINQPPTVDAGGPYTVPEGGTITISGSGTDPDGDPVTFAWDLDNNGSFEAPGQAVTFSAAGLTGGTARAVTLRSCDDKGACATANATISILTVITIITLSLPAGTVGLPYSATLEATGGTLPYTWSIEPGLGRLPNGLSLNPTTGEISGTPTAAGSFGFTVRVTDSSQITIIKRFTVTPPPSGGSAGTPYPDTPFVITPPSETPTTPPPPCSNYVLAPGSDPLPPGMSLDPTTGVLSGTPANGGTYNLIIQCTYNTNQTATKDFTITINNPAPVLTSLTPSLATEGDPAVTLTVTGSGLVTASVVHWNGAARPTTYVSARQLTTEITAADLASPSTATVTVVNPGPGGGNSNALSFQIKPRNLPPVVAAGSDRSGSEGEPVTLTGSASDPENNPLTITWSYTSGSNVDAGATCTFENGTTLTPTFRCTDDGNYTVTLSVSDGTNPPVTASVVITLANRAPELTIVQPTPGQLYPLTNGQATAELTASFTDRGTNDTHSCTVGWDDGTASQAGIVSEANGAGTCTSNKTYRAAGVYSVTVTVNDDNGGLATQTVMLVVYDPSGGFVTGGGWIASKAGDCQLNDPCRVASGKANFGFVSKYRRGATAPTGQTEFQFSAGGFTFQSSSYQWLVVSGPKAQFKGTGTVNGQGAYGFLLTATDGQEPGGGGVDRVRIKVWEVATGQVVYDNVAGAPEDIDQANPTAIGGGSIVVHKG